MLPWTPMETRSTTSQTIIPLMPNVSGVLPNPFNPFPFRMKHILKLVPSISSGYMPSTRYPMYSMPAHLGFVGVGVSLTQIGGNNKSQSFKLSSFNMSGGNATRVGPDAQLISSNWGTRSMPRISFLETLNITKLSNLMNYLTIHLPHWFPIPTKIPSDIPKFKGKDGEDHSKHIMTFYLGPRLTL